MAVITPAASVKATSEKKVDCMSSPSFQGRSPATISTMAVTAMAIDGRMKLRRMRTQRGRAPRQQRANAGEEEQKQADGDVDAVIERRAHRDLGALYVLGEHRETACPTAP